MTPIEISQILTQEGEEKSLERPLGLKRKIFLSFSWREGCCRTISNSIVVIYFLITFNILKTFKRLFIVRITKKTIIHTNASKFQTNHYSMQSNKKFVFKR